MATHSSILPWKIPWTEKVGGLQSMWSQSQTQVSNKQHRSSNKGSLKVAQSCPTLCNPVDCTLPGFSCPWDPPGKNTGARYHFLLQGIFQMQGSNLGLAHWRQTL